MSGVFDSARLAREWLEETAVAVWQHEFVDRRPLAKTTVCDLVERYVRERMQDGGVRRGAAEDRTGHIPAILRDPIAKIFLAEHEPGDVTEWRERRLLAAAPATVLKRMNLLSTILAYARAEWRISICENPASAANAPRPDHADTRRNRRLEPASAAAIRRAAASGQEMPSDEEVRWIDALSKSPCRHDVLLVQFAIARATRRGEALGLLWRDVDLEGRVLTLYGRHRLGTKTTDLRTSDAERRPLMREAAELLRSMLSPAGDLIQTRRYSRLELRTPSA